MTWTRRKWMLAAGSLPWALKPLQASGASSATGPAPNHTQRGNAGSAPPALGPPPILPDKASFVGMNGIYLNSAATHPRLAGAVELARRAADTGAADLFRPSTTRILANYAKLVGAGPSEIVFVPSTQAGESLFAGALGLPERGAHVVSDYLHFCGSQQMYTDMAKRGIDVTWIRMTPEGRVSLDDLDRAIVKGKTRLVAVSSTAFVNGFQHDLKRVCEIAHAKDALVYADIIQEAGNAPMNLADSGVDAACSGTYKWLMSSGTAFLYVRSSAMAQLQPPVYHWSRYTTMLPVTHMYPFDAPGETIVDGYTAKPGPTGLFSMGYEPNEATLAGLEYSLPYIQNIGVDKIQAHAQTLVSRLKEGLPRRGFTLLTPPEARSPIVTVVSENAGQHAAAFRAANINVTTRWNHIRVAVSVFNDMNDVDRLLAAMPKSA